MQLPGFFSRRVIGATATAWAAALAALAATSSPAAPRATAAASAPRCATSGLVVWLDTQGSGAAGSIYYELKLTNLSGHACTIRGYPGVSAVNLPGHRLGSPASRDTSHTPRLVRLSGGATANATLRIINADNFPSSTCRQVTAAGLRVSPPNQTASRVVPFPFRACSGRPGNLSVRAVQKP